MGPDGAEAVEESPFMTTGESELVETVPFSKSGSYVCANESIKFYFFLSHFKVKF